MSSHITQSFAFSEFSVNHKSFFTVLPPGMTQAIIPTLVKMGISAVSVGVNSMTPPPAVPNPFVWNYQGQSVIATWHKGKLSNHIATLEIS